MMTMSLIQLLQATFSPGSSYSFRPLIVDQAVLQDATQKLESFATENFGAYIAALCNEMAAEQNGTDVRYAAALAIKNTLTAKDNQRKDELIKRWFSTDHAVRGRVKEQVRLRYSV
jgi:importin subunit beta-1